MALRISGHKGADPESVEDIPDSAFRLKMIDQDNSLSRHQERQIGKNEACPGRSRQCHQALVSGDIGLKADRMAAHKVKRFPIGDPAGKRRLSIVHPPLLHHHLSGTAPGDAQEAVKKGRIGFLNRSLHKEGLSY